MHKREIGGYMGLEDYGCRSYHQDAIALNTGRNCLVYLIALRGIRSIALPTYLCGSVAKTCLSNGVTIREYSLKEDFSPDYGFELQPGEWLYLVDYFGQLEEREVEDALAFSSGRLIVDEVQGFFRPEWDLADTIYSCRKFFGVPDGAYLATRDGARLDNLLPGDCSMSRMGHVLGRFEDGAEAHYSEYREQERLLEFAPVACMSRITRSLLSAVDYDAVKNRREHNWRLLSRLLSEINLLDLENAEGPYVYPLLIEDADRVRKSLIAQRVYVPTLWPDVLRHCGENSVAYRFAKSILPLPVDQRYGAEEMTYIAKLIMDLLRR